MLVCPKCGHIDRSHWRRNRWRTNVEFLTFRQHPEDVDLVILNSLLNGHAVMTDQFYAYRISSRVIERIVLGDYLEGGLKAFHEPREHVDHTMDPSQTQLQCNCLGEVEK